MGIMLLSNYFACFFCLQVTVLFLAFRRKLNMLKDLTCMYILGCAMLLVVAMWVVPLVENISGGKDEEESATAGTRLPSIMAFGAQGLRLLLVARELLGK